MTLFILLAFILGLLIGSFVNARIYRTKANISIIKGRSICTFCKHALYWYDLVPILSFLWLKGKCRFCKKKISWQYPLVEMAMGLYFSAIFWRFFDFSFFGGILVLYYWIIGAILMAIFVYDYFHYIIPDEYVYSGIVVSLIFNIYFQTIYSGLLAGLVFAGFFALIFFISRGRWLGFGDVKLVALLGLWLGWPVIIPAMFFGFAFGAIIGIVLIFLGKKGMKSQVPFGPFLISGALVGLFFGNLIINWYLGLLYL